jgi:endo-1,4-beta-xylanase
MATCHVRHCSQVLLALLVTATLCLADDLDADIARHRRGQIVVYARPGTDVVVRQRRHHFTFGTRADARHLRNPRARDILKQYFNTAVVDKPLAWHRDGHPLVLDFRQADKLIDDCRTLGLAVHGGPMVWGCADDRGKGKFGSQAFWDAQHDASNERLRERLLHHVRLQAAYFRGRVDNWCLFNEPTADHADYYLRRLGPSLVDELLRNARQGNPHAVLLCNDYGTLGADGDNGRAFDRLLQRWLRRGVTVDAIGAEGHFWNHYPDPLKVRRRLDRLARFNLPVRITEFDYLAAGDLDRQARGLREFYRTAFAHPAVAGITMWGFGDRWHWTKNIGPQIPAGLWDEQLRPKPAGQMYAHLVRTQWWTDSSVRVDRRGVARIPAFFGDYDITVGDDAWQITITPDRPNGAVGFARLDPLLVNSYRNRRNLGEVLKLLMPQTASPDRPLAAQARTLRDAIETLHRSWRDRARADEAVDPQRAVEGWLRIASAFGKHPFGQEARDQLNRLDAEKTFQQRYAADLALEKLLDALRVQHGIRPADPTKGSKDPLARIAEQARTLRKDFPRSRAARVAESVQIGRAHV